ncbi:MAG: hypothetical protein JXA77_00430 [Bacteroidales bacterium]|nr:hypothetical protein [Bacteroidales bacterium]MBN2817639.1 hypothetical protein [Bacteroidales bacterium]
MRILVTLLFGFLCLNLFSQSLDWQPKTREIVLEKQDSSLRFRILISQEDVKAKKDYNYYWYYRNQINNNRGNFSGSLLHGEYQVFDNQDYLITKGVFKNGLKTGVWMRWNSNGLLLYSEKFHRGKLHGKRIVYGESGDVVMQNRYWHGELKGENESFFKIYIVPNFLQNDSTNTEIETEKEEIVIEKMEEENTSRERITR